MAECARASASQALKLVSGVKVGMRGRVDRVYPNGLERHACRNAKPKERSYMLFDSGGLYLHAAVRCTRTWRIKFKIANKEKLLTIGRYRAMTLTAARVKRDEVRETLDNGVDPTAKPVKVAPGRSTFREWAEAWLANQEAAWDKSTYRRIRGRIERDLYPRLGDR